MRGNEISTTEELLAIAPVVEPSASDGVVMFERPNPLRPLQDRIFLCCNTGLSDRWVTVLNSATDATAIAGVDQFCRTQTPYIR
jgi:hypothetical protein